MTHHDYVPGGRDDPGIQAVVEHAIDLVTDGARIGLGSGRAALLFIEKLGALQRDGFRVSGVPTSGLAAERARQAGIPLIALGEEGPLDLTIDGADEVAPNLDLVKGWGGALVRERIVAASSDEQVILVGEDKLVRALGERGRVPVEVIPMGIWIATRELEALGLVTTLRTGADGSQPYVTDNGNRIVDCALPEPLRDARAARELEQAILAIVGVVDTGLFLGTAGRVLVGHADGRVETLSRADSRKASSPNQSAAR
jgi:ribose 5-phosphate isomerase A